MEATEENLTDGQNILIKATRYQMTMAIQSDKLLQEAEMEIQLATRELIAKIIEQERTKLHLLLIGDFIFSQTSEYENEIKSKLSDFGAVRR